MKQSLVSDCLSVRRDIQAEEAVQATHDPRSSAPTNTGFRPSGQYGIFISLCHSTYNSNYMLFNSQLNE